MLNDNGGNNGDDKSQGRKAVEAGQTLRKAIIAEFKRIEIYPEQWRQTSGGVTLFSDMTGNRRCFLNKPYQNLYGNESDLPFLYSSPKECIAIFYQGQEGSGSVDMKFPYVAENAAQMSDDIGELWLTVEGAGFQPGAIRFLRERAEDFSKQTHRPMFVFSLSQTRQAIRSLLHKDSSYRLRKRILERSA